MSEEEKRAVAITVLICVWVLMLSGALIGKGLEGGGHAPKAKVGAPAGIEAGHRN